eukprot:8829760-Pyramimonas_sp.AAC.1
MYQPVLRRPVQGARRPGRAPVSELLRRPPVLGAGEQAQTGPPNRRAGRERRHDEPSAQQCHLCSAGRDPGWMGRQTQRSQRSGEPQGKDMDQQLPPRGRHHLMPDAPMSMGAQMAIQTRRQDPHVDAVKSASIRATRTAGTD